MLGEPSVTQCCSATVRGELGDDVTEGEGTCSQRVLLSMRQDAIGEDLQATEGL